MEEKELKVKTEQLLNRYKKLLGKMETIQETVRKTAIELREIWYKATENPTENPFKDFAFFFGCLSADLERLKDLKLYIGPKNIDRALELLAKNQNLKEKGDKNGKKTNKDQ